MWKTAFRSGQVATTARCVTSWRFRKSLAGPLAPRLKMRWGGQAAPPAPPQSLAPRPLPYRNIHGRNRSGAAARALQSLRDRQLVAKILCGLPNLAEIILFTDLL